MATWAAFVQFVSNTTAFTRWKTCTTHTVGLKSARRDFLYYADAFDLN